MSHHISNLRAKNKQYRLSRSLQYSRINILWFLLCTLIIAACRQSTSPTNFTPTTVPKIVATAWIANLIGKLEMKDGCLRLISMEDETDYVLVWPPDFSITIENNTVWVISGIVTGNHKEVLINIGETVKMSGGETEQLSEEMLQTLPSNCSGPYWIVGFEVAPFESTKEPN